MAQTTGPLFSITAKGTIGKALTYQSHKGRNTTRKMPRPSNPQTFPQRASRGGVTIANQLWAMADDSQKETWRALAEQKQITLYNAMLSDVLERKANGQPPRIAVGGGTAWSDPGIDDISISGAVGEVLIAVLLFDVAELTDLIFIALSPTIALDDNNFAQVLFMLTPNELDTNQATIPNIPPGEYSTAWFAAGTNGTLFHGSYGGLVNVT